MRRWLLLPLLLPLLAAMAVGLLNRDQPTRLRLLIWSTPTLPLGSWVLLAASAGALVAAGGTAAASMGGTDWVSPRRQVRYRDAPQAEDSDWGREAEPAVSSAAEADPRSPQAAEASGDPPWPERSPHDAPPTVSVPFRVVMTHRSAAAEPEPVRANAAATPHADDWSDGPDEEW